MHQKLRHQRLPLDRHDWRCWQLMNRLTLLQSLARYCLNDRVHSQRYWKNMLVVNDTCCGDNHAYFPSTNCFYVSVLGGDGDYRNAYDYDDAHGSDGEQDAHVSNVDDDGFDGNGAPDGSCHNDGHYLVHVDFGLPQP